LLGAATPARPGTARRREWTAGRPLSARPAMMDATPDSPWRGDSMASVTEKSSTGLDANLAAMLCYAIGWVTGLIFFVLEKDSRFVKYHAMQSIIVSLAFTVVWYALLMI